MCVGGVRGGEGPCAKVPASSFLSPSPEVQGRRPSVLLLLTPGESVCSAQDRGGGDVYRAKGNFSCSAPAALAP